MKNGIKKTITFIIAAAMLSAGVYAETADEAVEIAAEEAVEVATATAAPSEVDQTAVDDAAADDIYDEDVLPNEADNAAAFPELGDIEKYLAVNGYPDYLSFVFNSGAAMNGYDPSSGEEYQPQITYLWDVGVVNATAAQKDEIKALIDELYPIENIVTFVDCTYSYAEREALIPEIRETAEMLFPEAKIIEISLIRNTELISVVLEGINGDQQKQLAASFREKYGDLVILSDAVTTDDGYDMGGALPEAGMGAGTEIAAEVIDEAGIAIGSNEDGNPAPAIGGDVDSAPTVGEVAAIASPTEQSNNNTLLWICIAAALVVALGTAAFIFRARLIPVFATSNGDVTAKKLSRKQAEEAVKNSEAIPDDSVLQAIKEKIDK